MKRPVIVDLNFFDAGKHADVFDDRETIDLANAANEGRDLSGIDYALVWKPRPDLFKRARDLKVVFSGGAGVDHVLTLPDLPQIPLVRFVDESLTTRMSEWVVMQCLLHLRQFVANDVQRRQQLWAELPQPEAREVTVGIMGLGILGQDAAFKLQIMGFNVIGWSRSAKRLKGMRTFAASELDSFLSQTDMLVGLLPLTQETRGIFNLDLFRKLHQGGALKTPVFINAGRGASQIEADIVSALDKEILGGASLDVFETEPLPQSSPLWDHPKAFITPHVAAISDRKSLIAHVNRQIERFESGLPLEYVVDRKLGY